MPAPPASRRHALAAALVALSAVAAACGSSESGGGTAATVDEGLAPTVTIEAEGDPVDGGELVYGLEAESEGWNPTKTRWATSGTTVALTMFDPLAAFDDGGRVVPYLAEEITPNASFTEWTITLREGVRFHNGEPLTSAAVKASLEGHAASSLTGALVTPIERVDTPDERTAVVVMSEGWSAFPAMLTGQIGMVPAPAQLADPTEGNVSHPIGTGPFVFDEWLRDDQLVVERNDDYWRDGLPHLDSITFRTVRDPSERLAALESGQLDMAHLKDPATVAAARELAAAGDAQVVLDPTEPEELFLLLNQGRPPFDDLDAREAVRAAVDVDAYLDTFGEGITERATGPFPSSSPWYAETEWPDADPGEARALVEDLEADGGDLTVELIATKTPDDIASATMIEGMLEEAGIDVEVRYLDQQDLLLQTSAGTYDIALWRGFSAPDPDGDYLSWHSSTSRPVGELSINLGRLEDAEVDAALDAGRGTLDAETRTDAYADLQQRFTEVVPYVWIHHVPWTIVADTDVRDIANGPLPSGQASLPFGGPAAGSHRLAQVWIED